MTQVLSHLCISSGIFINLLIKRDIMTDCQLTGHFFTKYMGVIEDVANF